MASMNGKVLSFLDRPARTARVLRMDDRGRRAASQEMAFHWDHEALIARQTEFWEAMWVRHGRPPEWDRDIIREGGI